MSNVSIEGLNELCERLDHIAEPDNLQTALGNACALVEREAKRNAPKDTGALRRSITSRIENQGDSIQGVVYTPLEYAPYVCYGTGIFAEEGGRSDVPWHYQDDAGNWHTTSGQHPHPFMRPALDDNRDRIISMIQEALMHD